MRKVLMRFVFDDYWQCQSVGNELLVGAGWLVVFWLAIAAVASAVNYWLKRDLDQIKGSAFFWLILPAFVVAVPLLNLPLEKTGIPVFGYGFMMFVGFSSATLLAAKRCQKLGLHPDIIWDMMMWVLIPGLLGARIFYLIQYAKEVFKDKQGLDRLLAIIALWDGGLVFYGSILGGVVGVFLYCRQRDINPLVMLDVLAPSMFIGEGFGRIGCFLYGCCYGGACTLPWAVQFPPDSITFTKLVERGTIPANAAQTIPLHPTQIYSSLAAFLLAGILAWFFRRRPFDGAVLCVGWIVYPIIRYGLEILRDDEPGQLGTDFTISQLISLGLVITGIGTMVWLGKRNVLTRRVPPSPRRPNLEVIRD